MTDVMSVPEPRTPLSVVRGWQSWCNERWAGASQTNRTRVQVGVLLASVLVAYNYSLSTLLQTANQQTPLAYVSLVPAIALALAAIRARPLRPEPPIYDRHVDYTIGIPLILAAIAINELLPARMSAMFWVYRIDLVTLPMFVAGVVAIIFGTRVLWRQRLAVCFLFLAWPYPYQRYLLGVLNAFTTLTLLAMQKIALWAHLAKPAGSLDNTLFVINHHGSTFALSVVSACSGVNGVVGFLLVGSAFAAIVKGPIVRKVLWLTGGVALLWVINLARIAFIFFAGKEWGERVAINVFHPFIGLVTFSLGVLAMILLIKPLGMHINIGEGRKAAEPEIGPIPVPTLFDDVAPDQRSKVSLAVPKVTLAVVAVVVAALVVGVTNGSLRTYNLVAGVTGQAKLLAYIRYPSAPPGWIAQYDTSYGWAKPLFGDTSQWNRYILRSAGPGPLQTNVPVVADVINTPDLSSFSAYGVENCYTFHGYALADVAQVSLVGGVTGQAMSYISQQYGSWSIVYWIIPVKMFGGGTNYERTVLYVQNSGQGAVVKGLTTGDSIHNIGGSLNPGNSADRALINNRTFLVAFAKKLIDVQARRSASFDATAGTS